VIGPGTRRTNLRSANAAIGIYLGALEELAVSGNSGQVRFLTLARSSLYSLSLLMIKKNQKLKVQY